MKKSIYTVVALFIMTSCGGGGTKTAQDAGEVASAGENAIVYTVDPEASSLRWEGAKITQTVHHGTVQIAEGSLSFDEGALVAGSFIIDMNTIVCEDLDEASGKLKLEGHLKSADFFMVENYPTAMFEITGAEAINDGSGATHRISGNLTIKDVTKGISFPAVVTVGEGGVTASARFEINRNEWGVVWGGSLTEQSVKDFLQNNLIKDTIAFEVNLVATN
ncbi:MAG TPA: YceI family protein [Bacteroidales bacterium]|nr:YceI family protein [Bacteroidales bacterium]